MKLLQSMLIRCPLRHSLVGHSVYAIPINISPATLLTVELTPGNTAQYRPMSSAYIKVT
jgi:hypothetical protein